MAKHNPVEFNQKWHEEHDQARLVVFINVDQKTGSYGLLEEVVHYGRADEVKMVWATIKSEDTDNSPEARWRMLRQVLMMQVNRAQRAQELDIEPV